MTGAAGAAQTGGKPGARHERLATYRDQVGAEQVAALFRVVATGVIGAAGGAAILAGSLLWLGRADSGVGFSWAGFIAACAVAHIWLRRRYQRARPQAEDWRRWAFRFTAISLAEGMGWGAATLLPGSRADLEAAFLVLLVAFGISAGAVPAFGPFLPAFFCLFLPATLPFVIVNLGTTEPILQVALVLMVVFIGGVGLLGVAANRSFIELVSLRIRTEQMAGELRRQKEIAEQASLDKSTFLAAASHDLRQPIHALGLFVGALRGIVMSPEGRRLVEQIEASIAAMDGLFSGLLDISRLDAGIVEVHRRPFAIAALLDRICRDHVEEADTKGLSLVWKPCRAIVDTDPVLAERILRNLVSNAVLHTREGRIVVGCRRRGPSLAVQVWDTGPGIPPDQQERVFQEYYQLGNAERDRSRGLGLGLAIVRRLTQLLDCALTLRSVPGRGSCFEVAIPLATGSEMMDEPAATGDAGAFATGLVVVIDDEMAVREAMSSLLESWGHQVIAAGSGDEIIERLSICLVRPHLIISDYRLREGETGIEVIDRLQAEYNEPIPAMLVTGDTAPDRLVEAQASGLLLLHKPVSNSRLRAAIANLVGVAETSQAEDTGAIVK